jgi:hypothetical protein
MVEKKVDLKYSAIHWAGLSASATQMETPKADCWEQY